MSGGGFRVKDLFRRREPDDPPDNFPPEVNLWGYATRVALSTGLIAGFLRGARQGYALGRARAKVQGVDAAKEKKFVKLDDDERVGARQFARGSWHGSLCDGTAGSRCGCVGIRVAARTRCSRGGRSAGGGGADCEERGAAWTGAVVMGGMMGLVFGLVRQGLEIRILSL